MDHSDNINEIGAALAKAQGAIKNAIKDKANPYFKSTYADLAGVWDACRAELSSNGLSVIQTPGDADRGISITTMLLHSSGQWIKSTYNMPVAKPDAQSVGSAITYARRYSLAAMVGVAQDDDDGNKANGNGSANGSGDIAGNGKQEKKLPPYLSSKFDANFPQWEKSIKEGKLTHESIINTITSAYVLSDEQISKIKGIK
jgi:hypothetical protein